MISQSACSVLPSHGDAGTGLLVVARPRCRSRRAVRTWLPDGTFLHVKE